VALLSGTLLSFRCPAPPDLAKGLEVGAHYDLRTQIISGRQWPSVGQVIHGKANCDLALDVRPLMDRSKDGAFFEIRDHFFEEVSCNQSHLSVQCAGANGVTDGQAVGGAHVQTFQRAMAGQESVDFLKCFVLFIVPFHDLQHAPPVGVGWEHL